MRIKVLLVTTLIMSSTAAVTVPQPVVADEDNWSDRCTIINEGKVSGTLPSPLKEDADEFGIRLQRGQMLNITVNTVSENAESPKVTIYHDGGYAVRGIINATFDNRYSQAGYIYTGILTKTDRKAHFEVWAKSSGDYCIEIIDQKRTGTYDWSIIVNRSDPDVNLIKVRDLEDKIVTLQNRMDRLQSEIKNQEQNISALKSTVDKKNQQIKKQKQIISNLNSTLNEKNQRIERLKQTISKLNSTLSQKNKRIQELEAKLNAQTPTGGNVTIEVTITPGNNQQRFRKGGIAVVKATAIQQSGAVNNLQVSFAGQNYSVGSSGQVAIPLATAGPQTLTFRYQDVVKRVTLDVQPPNQQTGNQQPTQQTDQQQPAPQTDQPSIVDLPGFTMMTTLVALLVLLSGVPALRKKR